MGRKAAATPDGRSAESVVAVLDRVRARAPQDKKRSIANIDGGKPLEVKTPVEGTLARTASDGHSVTTSARSAPKTIEEWCDDRELACFGGRVRLNRGESVLYDILSVMRTEDPDLVRFAVRTAGKDADPQVRHMVYLVISNWAPPGFAYDVHRAAVSQAEQLKWNLPPRKQQRGPDPIDQNTGRR